MRDGFQYEPDTGVLTILTDNGYSEWTDYDYEIFEADGKQAAKDLYASVTELVIAEGVTMVDGNTFIR